ncbi:MAG TPA: cob(I)yrinic acid a,c-diamide adenosyltransferase [Acidimicrobiales bacterium]
MRIYTRRGDDGTTGLLFGGRVSKGSARIALAGAVDEAQAAMGLARAESEPGSELDQRLISLERDLYVLMAEVATAPSNRRKLVPAQTLVTAEMVRALEAAIDELTARTTMPQEFVIPGSNRPSAALDVARTAVRRAERGVGQLGQGSLVGEYLNRCSDLLWTMARWQEGEEHLLSRTAPRRARRASGATDEVDEDPAGTDDPAGTGDGARS